MLTSSLLCALNQTIVSNSCWLNGFSSSNQCSRCQCSTGDISAASNCSWPAAVNNCLPLAKPACKAIACRLFLVIVRSLINFAGSAAYAVLHDSLLLVDANGETHCGPLNPK